MLLKKKQKPSDLFTVTLNSYWACLTIKPTSTTAGKTEPKKMKIRFLKYNFQV